jgi:hypothetical protein
MKPPLSYTERAQAAYAAAEAATDPRDKAAYRAAAQTWERLATPRTGGYSFAPHVLQLAALKRDVTEAVRPRVEIAHEIVDARRAGHMDVVRSLENERVRYPAKQAAIIEF